jgi:hypothetical protein
MSRLNSKQLVLDANLSLGSSNSRFNPQGMIHGDKRRNLLEAVREEGHIAVFNRQLRREWREHGSDWGNRIWLREMDKKRQTIDREGAEYTEVCDSASLALVNKGERIALAKDFHLIQSALATGHIIVSEERVFPRLVAQAGQAVMKLKELYFANPSAEGESCRLWVKAGAEMQPTRRIDVWAENFLARNN